MLVPNQKLESQRTCHIVSAQCQSQLALVVFCKAGKGWHLSPRVISTMKGTLPALCIIASLFSTVFSRKCTFCGVVLKMAQGEHYDASLKKLDKPECKGPVFTCRDDHEVCASIYVSAKKHEYYEEVYFNRQCISRSDCNVTESLTTPGLKISYSITCCSEDGCTPLETVLKPENKTKNGVLCPGYYSEDKQAEAKYSMECTGDEIYCLNFQRKTMYGMNHIYSSGCTTMWVYEADRYLPFLTKPKGIEKHYCTNVKSNSELKAGHFIWCNICHDYNVDNCTDLHQLCAPEEDVCLFERTKSIYDGMDDVVIIKRCGQSSECNRGGSIHSSTKLILMNTTCCDQHMCHPPLPSLPSNTSDFNGLVCPACFVPNSDRCLGRNDLKCTGNEKRCVHYLRTEMQELSSVTETLHGCTTKNICEAGSSLVLPNGHYYKTVKTEIMCNGAVALNSAFYRLLLFAFTVVYVLKIDC